MLLREVKFAARPAHLTLKKLLRITYRISQQVTLCTNYHARELFEEYFLFTLHINFFLLVCLTFLLYHLVHLI